MKKLYAILIITGLILFSACKKNKEDDSLPITIPNINKVVILGQWHATYYFIDGVNPGTGGNLYGYNFIFNSNGDLRITNITFNYPGSWSTSDMNGQVRLLLNSPYPSAFTNLSKDWDVTRLSNTKISLEFTNNSSGTTDVLTLEKGQ